MAVDREMFLSLDLNQTNRRMWLRGIYGAGFIDESTYVLGTLLIDLLYKDSE